MSTYKYRVSEYGKEWTPGEIKDYSNIKSLREYGNLPECYDIKIIPYTHSDKHYWNCLKIVIFKDGKKYMNFNRNYHAEPPMVYIKHEDKEYLITSGDYQTIMIINLTDKKFSCHCLGNHDNGTGFCPTDIQVTDDNELFVEGCYWGGPIEHFYINNFNPANFKFPKKITFYDEDGNET